jgi:hypothetical protein
MPDKFRLVIWEPEFEADLRALTSGLGRARECIKGLEWLLARDPHAGHAVEGADPVRYFPLVQSGFPPIFVFYTFSPVTVWFLSVRRLDATNGHGAH